MKNPLFARLAEQGHVISRDFTTPGDIESGKLEELVKNGIVYAITTNPTSNEAVYMHDSGLQRRAKVLATTIDDVTQVYDELFISAIIVPATVVLEKVNRAEHGIAYHRSFPIVLQQKTRFLHGYASYEFRPRFTQEAEKVKEGEVRAALDEILRLSSLIQKKTGRKNFFIKVPATPSGIEAGKRALALGCNINYTLVASSAQYEETVKAAILGKHEYFTRSGTFSEGCAAESVSSIFVSRTDRAIDPLVPAGIKGQAGLAYVKLRIYPVFERYFLGDHAIELIGEDWQSFAKLTGARIQQIYWGSTGVKDEKGKYTTDPKYMGQLKAPGTTNTAPPEVIDALSMMKELPFDASLTIWNGLDEARNVLEKIASMGIGIEAQLHAVYKDGLAAFAKSDAATFARLEKDIRG